MMKQYMKNKSLFLQKEELLSRIAELFSKKILRPSGVLVFLLITCLGLFSCSKFLEENPKDKLPEDDVYNTISEVYLNAVASLYTYVGGYSDSQGLQGTGRGVYDLNTFTSDEAIIPTRGGDWYDGGFWQGLYLHDWGIENDAIQATWEYLYKVVMLSNKSLERIDKFAETFRYGTAGIPCRSTCHAGYVLLLPDGFVRTHPASSILFRSNERCSAK
ncbi:SusD family [Bacteroides ovatus]|nr:SusD family [Bacteroides ovatus]